MSACLFSDYYSVGINQLVLAPPSPRSFGIIELGGKSRQVFGFKGLIGKVFRNKDLICQIALKMGLGQLRGPSWLTGAPLTTPIRSSLSRMAGWMSVMDGPDVCDERGGSSDCRKRPVCPRVSCRSAL